MRCARLSNHVAIAYSMVIPYSMSCQLQKTRVLQYY